MTKGVKYPNRLDRPNDQINQTDQIVPDRNPMHAQHEGPLNFSCLKIVLPQTHTDNYWTKDLLPGPTKPGPDKPACRLPAKLVEEARRA